MDTICSANGQRQTVTLNYELSIMWETKPRTIPQKSSGLLMGPEEVKRPKNSCKKCDDDGDDDDEYSLLG